MIIIIYYISTNISYIEILIERSTETGSFHLAS